MREVTKEQFYQKIGPLNVAGRITNREWPYTMDFYLQNSYDRKVIAKKIGEKVGPFEVSKFYIE